MTANLTVPDAQTLAAHGSAVCTCGRIRRLARRVTQIYDGFLEPHGFTITQFGILAQIRRQQDLSVGALADQMVMDPTTLTRNLRPLEKRGFIKMVAGADDRRRRTILLTERGRAAFREAVPAWRRAQEHTAAALGGEQFTALNHTLDGALTQLRQ
jgi:DNA-binding MarR family transcriptional regulator